MNEAIPVYHGRDRCLLFIWRFWFLVFGVGSYRYSAPAATTAAAISIDHKSSQSPWTDCRLCVNLTHIYTHPIHLQRIRNTLNKERKKE